MRNKRYEVFTRTNTHSVYYIASSLSVALALVYRLNKPWRIYKNNKLIARS